MLKTIFKSLFSADKFQVLRSLEILTGLCNSKNNESLICDFVDEKVLSRLFTLITAKDIMLCIFSLETIYQVCLTLIFEILLRKMLHYLSFYVFIEDKIHIYKVI